MQTKNELTRVQAETLTFIAEYRKKNGYSPTVAEMAKAANVNGNAISDRITAMIKKGAITKTPGIARSIRPTSASRDQG
jgi:SOS-response transcriptional repressor LexA